MTNDILCIIPARKGSKGIANKNRQSISGVPLFVYSVRSALQSGIDGSKIIVSSDDEEILYLASKWKVNPYKRSSELSQDNSSTEDCLIDVINNIDITDIKSVLLLQPTSPIRFKNRIEDAVETYKSGDYDSLISVSKFYPFFWHYKYDEKLQMDTCVSTYDIQSRPMRQKLTKYDIAHFENGNIYITDINVLKNTKCRIGSKPCLYEISDIESMQIDSFEQLEAIDIIISSSSGRFLRKEIKNDKKYELCNIVAEACCNHMGDIDIAVEMIKTAKLCGANYIKFQKRYLELAVTKEMQKAVHPNPQHSFGSTYMEHRKALEFDIHQHDYLKRICDECDIGYACSVWDQVSAEEIIELNVDFIKIPSAMNGNYKLLDFVYKNYLGSVHISLGMISKEKINELFDYLKQYQNRTVVYWTTSGYPVKFDELFLLEINNIIDNGFCAGYSGHHLGIAVDIAAYTLGCQWIERHFTLDRTWKGTDHAASLEPAGLKKLCRDIVATQKSFKYKESLTLDEQKNSQKLRIEESVK